MKTENQNKEKAILVALKTPRIKRSAVEEYLTELEMLTDTAGGEVVVKIIQERAKPHPAYFIGKGKAEEIALLAEMNDAPLIIFDDDLTPSQVRNLEKIINRKIIDRTGLILDIFAKHAQTSEAKTQVELAQLQYTLSRLTRAWTHLSKQYGGIGTKGPGETQIETDRRIIRNRISRLKNILQKIEKQQQTQSAKRKSEFQITLVGYTNAGKSTLLNLLTDAKTLAENKLFATLDSTTRFYGNYFDKKILISDTVGFIRKLPPTLVASFRSTLNVINQADLILHVVDISNPSFEEQIKIVNETLKSLNCDKKRTITVFNKVDKVSSNQTLLFVRSLYPDAVYISAERGININELKKEIEKNLSYNNKTIEATLPINETKKLSLLHSLAIIKEKTYFDDYIKVKLITSSENAGKIIRLLALNNK